MLERECREQHRGFLCVLARGPAVRGAQARRHARRPDRHRRAASRAGSRARPRARPCTGCGAAPTRSGSARETALADDPELTARARRSRRAPPACGLVADTRLRLPPSARMLRGAPGSTWVLCGAGAPRARRRALEAAGARVLELPRRGRSAGSAPRAAAPGARGLDRDPRGRRWTSRGRAAARGRSWTSCTGSRRRCVIGGDGTRRARRARRRARSPRAPRLAGVALRRSATTRTGSGASRPRGRARAAR